MAYETITVDTEEPLRQYLIDNIAGITSSNIAIKSLNPGMPDKAVMVRRDGSYNSELYTNIDRARILIVCRDTTPKGVKDLAFSIRNLLHRLDNKTMGNLYVYCMENDAGPEWIDDDDSKLYKMYLYFQMIVREE